MNIDYCGNRLNLTVNVLLQNEGVGLNVEGQSFTVDGDEQGSRLVLGNLFQHF